VKKHADLIKNGRKRKCRVQVVSTMMKMKGGDQKAIAHIIDNMSIRMTEHAHTTKHMVDVFLQQPVVLI
jgi:hypothetical protein